MSLFNESKVHWIIIYINGKYVSMSNECKINMISELNSYNFDKSVNFTLSPLEIT